VKWQLVAQAQREAPFGLWYRNRQHAASYAEWVSRELDRGEILVYNTDGALADRRVVERAAP
jgi:hypothetical protein